MGPGRRACLPTAQLCPARFELQGSRVLFAMSRGLGFADCFGSIMWLQGFRMEIGSGVWGLGISKFAHRQLAQLSFLRCRNIKEWCQLFMIPQQNTGPTANNIGHKRHHAGCRVLSNAFLRSQGLLQPWNRCLQHISASSNAGPCKVEKDSGLLGFSTHVDKRPCRLYKFYSARSISRIPTPSS